MKEFIKEVPSDTTINKIYFENGILKVYLTFYTEEKHLLIFNNVLGYKVTLGWGVPEGIEGIEIKTEGLYIKEIIKIANDNQEPANNVKCFTFICSNDPVVEVIAKDFELTKT